jgi:ABC-type Mn2+/Zn2+ transport system permease subunit
MADSFLLQIITGTAIGLAAGYLGSMMVLRRMSLVGDALSHVALPGIAIALLMGIDPFIGAFAALAAAVVGIWWLGRTTSLPSETLVGIFFTLSLAIGLLLTPQPELLEALFGDISSVTFTGTLAVVACSALAIVLVHSIRRVLILDIISPDLAKVSGNSVARAEFLFLFLVALMIALGLRIAGTLLTGSLVIIPAAAARTISPSLSQYSLMSAVFGGFSALVGIYAAHVFSLPPGPMVILTGGVLFAATLPFRRS